MSNIKFKVEVNDVEIKEGDIVDVTIGTDYAITRKDRFPFITENHIGRVMSIDNTDRLILLDCSKEYEAKTVQFSLDSIEKIKVKIV